MATGKRASMREGPLAQLFRKTDGEDQPAAEETPREQQQEHRAPTPSRAAAGRCPRVAPSRR